MNPTNEVVAYAKTTIKLSARKLIGKCGITAADLEDIESEMMLDVLHRLPQHNSRRWSYKTFIPHIVKNKSHHVLRSRCAEKEYFFRQAQSMDAPCKSDTDAGNESLTLHDVISQESLHGTRGLNDFEHGELCSDLASVISNLSDVQRQCCHAIMNEESVAKIAKDHDMPRSTFYKHVIVPIRQAFREAGLEDYLK
jgi:DNA-directed RNA polymerase specialized sigma24 family protein